MSPFRLLVLFSAAATVGAHPMGNFSVSHYKFTVGRDSLRATYAVDLAGVPTLEVFQRWRLEPASPMAAVQSKARQQMAEWAHRLTVNADRVIAVEGDGGKLLSSTAAREDRSKGLTAYPPEPDKAPPQQVAAVIEAPRLETALEVVLAQSVPVAPREYGTKPISGEVTKGDYLSKLLGQREITLGMALIGLAAAFGLGAIHALSPGHGKTMVAAYLVGSRGTPRHAVLLGLVTTITHTISVFALGFVTLFLSQYILADQLYPVLGVLSGLTIIWVGGRLFWKRLIAVTGHHHHHHHDHDHAHEHHHHHGPGGHSHMPEGDITMGSLIALGASGGLVPCPSGLVLLLSAIAIGRPGLGLVLLTAFSAGLAVVLMGIGIAVLYAKHLLPESAKQPTNPFFRYAPVVSAAVIVMVGCVMTAASIIG